ncbi:MAG: Fic family protein [Nitrospirota bacterium]
MATPGELLAKSLEVMRSVQQEGIILSSDMPRIHRERLLKVGFLQEIIKGWLLAKDHALKKWDSTPWYASFWSFVRRYLGERFGDEYCLSQESSVKIHTGSTAIPKQLVVITKGKGTQLLQLPFETSLFMYQDKRNFPAERVSLNGLWVMDLPAALCRLQPASFKNDPTDTEIALRILRDASPLLHILLEGGNTAIAGRLAGAYKFLGEEEIANRIVKGMEAAGYKIRLSNPFERDAPSLTGGTRIISPYVSRIEALWKSMRDDVLAVFPKAPGMPKDPERYLRKVDKLYVNDAYNSLSIEGYEVTAGLIERVRDGQWNPENIQDRQQRDALAAKGYSLAFKSVEESIRKILSGNNPGEVVRIEHHEWYSQMFSPSVQAGILKPSDLAGYRNGQVFIKGSKHVPLPKEAVLDCMEMLFGLLKEERDAGVRAVLGHFVFVFIHPYMDGNGRMGRFLMNAMLASGGYPWTVIRLSRRELYMSALEEASVHGRIKPFAEFIKEELAASSLNPGQ